MSDGVGIQEQEGVSPVDVGHSELVNNGGEGRVEAVEGSEVISYPKVTLGL